MLGRIGPGGRSADSEIAAVRSGLSEPIFLREIVTLLYSVRGHTLVVQLSTLVFYQMCISGHVDAIQNSVVFAIWFAETETDRGIFQ